MRPFFPVAALAAVLVLSGCRSGSALHSRYNNFRAYYNTYYNASRKLEEGERALLNVNTPIDRGVLVTLFPTGASASGRTPAFQAAIEKSAELLRNRPTASWADDALLVIGKAFFYERNPAGAEQKFRETIEAAELNRDRRLSDEARFWLGRTLASADRFEEGVGVLREGIERPGGPRHWTARMHLALGELYARAGRWDDAASALREGLPDVRDADLAGRGGLLLGQVEEAAGRYEAAADAYADALRRGPAFEIAFAAEIGRALVLGLDAGRAPEALEALRRMARDDKNFARRAEVALAQGRVLALTDDRAAARARLRDVLYDASLAGQGVRGEAHVRMGELYRDAFGDYVRAAAHFDTAATALGSRAATSARLSRAALTNARQTAQTFSIVARATTRMTAVDSLLALGSLDDDAFRARVEQIEEARRVAWLAEQRQVAALQAAQEFSGGNVPGFQQGRPGGGFGAAGAALTGAEGVASGGLAGPGLDIGFLGYRDPRTLQTGQIAFTQLWGDRPLVPNWRRAAAVRASGAVEGVAAGPRARGAGPAQALGPPRLDLSAIPRTAEQHATLVAERASLRYELGNAFFLSLGRADLAEPLYRQVIEETPDAPVALRARYALGDMHAEGGRDDTAADLFRAVVTADSAGVLARAARVRLGEAERGLEPGPAAADEAAFRSAREMWDDGQPLLAANAFVRLGDADPRADLAPRAFFAAALAVVDAARGDTLTLLAPLPADLVPATFDAGPMPDETPAAAPIQFDDPSAPRAGIRQPGMTRATSAARPEPAAAVPAAAVLPAGDAPAEAGSPARPARDLSVREYLLELAAAYPGTPVATRARALADALPKPRAEPGPDAPEPDPADDLDPAEAAAPFGLRGEQPVDASLGGVTWRLALRWTADEVRADATLARAARLRNALWYDAAEQTYALVVGQFLTSDDALIAAERIPPELLEEAEIVPVAGLVFVPAPR